MRVGLGGIESLPLVNPTRVFIAGGQRSYFRDKIEPLLSGMVRAGRYGIEVIGQQEYQQGHNAGRYPPRVELVLIIASASGHGLTRNAAAQARRQGIPYALTSHQWVLLRGDLERLGFIEDRTSPRSDAAAATTTTSTLPVTLRWGIGLTSNQVDAINAQLARSGARLFETRTPPTLLDAMQAVAEEAEAIADIAPDAAVHAAATIRPMIEEAKKHGRRPRVSDEELLAAGIGKETDGRVASRVGITPEGVRLRRLKLKLPAVRPRLWDRPRPERVCGTEDTIEWFKRHIMDLAAVDPHGALRLIDTIQRTAVRFAKGRKPRRKS